jgi:hypothetical protein
MINYDLHGLVKVSFNKDFSPKFVPEYFRVPGAVEADLVVSEGWRGFEKKGRKKFREFYGGGGKLFFESSKLRAIKYGLGISDLMENAKFSFKQDFRFLMMEDFVELVQLMIEIKLLQHGCTFVHAAGVSKGRNGYMMTASGGVGKTSAMVALAGKGFKIMGDELVILSKTGTLYSFPTIVTIHSNTANIQLSAGKKVEGKVRRIIHRVSPIEPPISPGVGLEPSEIGVIEKESRLKKVFFLEKGLTEKIGKLSRADAVKRMVGTNVQEIFRRDFVSRVFKAYCSLNDIEPGFIENQMERIFNRALLNCYLVKSERKQHHNLILNEIV